MKTEDKPGVRWASARSHRLSVEEFTLQAIDDLREGDYKGIHTLRSGFNDFFKEYFGPDADPVAATKELEVAGKIVIGGSRDHRGVMLYKPGEEPAWQKKLREQKAPTQSGMSVGLSRILSHKK